MCLLSVALKERAEVVSVEQGRSGGKGGGQDPTAEELHSQPLRSHSSACSRPGGPRRAAGFGACLSFCYCGFLDKSHWRWGAAVNPQGFHRCCLSGTSALWLWRRWGWPVELAHVVLVADLSHSSVLIQQLASVVILLSEAAGFILLFLIYCSWSSYFLRCFLPLKLVILLQSVMDLPLFCPACCKWHFLVLYYLDIFLLSSVSFPSPSPHHCRHSPP